MKVRANSCIRRADATSDKEKKRRLTVVTEKWNESEERIKILANSCIRKVNDIGYIQKIYVRKHVMDLRVSERRE